MDDGSILVVCTGNVCRSPLVERLLQRALDARYGPDAPPVRSAGTGALVDHPMDDRAAAVLAGLGGSSDGFLARRLTEPMLAAADLVLTATRDHRAVAVRMHPRALRRTFTVRELAAIVAGLRDEELPEAVDPVERVRELAEVARSRRGVHGQGAGEDHDVVDPFRRADAVYRRMRTEVAGALPHLIRGLGA